MKLCVRPAPGPLSGALAPPGDKSVSHRAAIFGGLADGTTRIEGFLEAGDTLATLAAMADLGARVERDGGRVEISGGRLRAPAAALDLGNSGTGIRLLTGALAGHPDLIGERVELIGDASLSRRPMDRIIEPLAAMGARIDSRDGHAPLVVRPCRLHPAEHRLKIASAQVKSAILLAALNADGATRVIEPGPSRDHTERLLPAFGVEPRREGDGLVLEGPARLHAAEIEVPGDLSSAAFPIAAAVLVPGSAVRIGPVGVNPSRDGFLRVLERMAPGAVRRRDDGAGRAGTEPSAVLEIRSVPLAGVEIPREWVPLAIDEFPVIMALAACAEGETRISGAEELRVKESDRLAVMSRQLRRLGVEVEERPDGALVRGGPVRGGEVDAEGDHRIAMSLAVLALAADAPVKIHGAEWIRTSYPAFVDDLNALATPGDGLPAPGRAIAGPGARDRTGGIAEWL
ncbi:MAG: 3-phosphoshikimate 1-carboxyvinyltransferase [Wenzhouxiangellaceae bacterium]|nr:3-phosphoshikimate 1-carboxyvinyltransferase [Wenzhouxiangellaceae bacterium]